MMNSGFTQQQRELIRSICSDQKVGGLATCNGEAAHSSLVFFAVDEHLETLVFSTLRSTRKYSNLSKCPKVSVLIDSRTDNGENIGRSAALTVSGTASEASSEEIEFCRCLLIRKHPEIESFLSEPDCALICLKEIHVQLVGAFTR